MNAKRHGWRWNVPETYLPEWRVAAYLARQAGGGGFPRFIQSAGVRIGHAPELQGQPSKKSPAD